VVSFRKGKDAGVCRLDLDERVEALGAPQSDVRVHVRRVEDREQQLLAEDGCGGVPVEQQAAGAGSEHCSGRELLRSSTTTPAVSLTLAASAA
jgi:hypothetical protein